MRARMALTILAALALCSGAMAQSSTKVFRIGLVHVGIPGSCILSPALKDAFARRGYIEDKTNAILLVADSLTVINHKAVFDYAIAHHLPDMEELDLLAHIGGLMAYSTDETEVFDRVAALSDRI
jgi:hypothetical protein